MSKYLNVFNTLAEYQAFSASTEYTQPNVSLVKETNVLYYDYGNNQPKADMSNYKGEFAEISEGGDNFGKDAITKINYIPSGITIMDSSFKNCTSLISIPNIPSSVKNVYQTFSHCSNLVNVPPIPRKVIFMEYTFFECKKLKTVTILPTTPPNHNSTFYGCNALESIYVPDESVDTYKTATGWSEFADKIKPLSEKPTE